MSEDENIKHKSLEDILSVFNITSDTSKDLDTIDSLNIFYNTFASFTASSLYCNSLFLPLNMALMLISSEADYVCLISRAHQNYLLLEPKIPLGWNGDYLDIFFSLQKTLYGVKQSPIL